ncbi:hypothetical protein FGIG_10727 [Fasciola gigantica]|uniref:Uncharacterized protein n=1 Tax=Fasciola gigantica TaxID=46835 RepID=A0A504Y5X1_FASGI|nr:hypothetical protein FGIG_10727 [Fasciola gigantica]
MFAWFRDLFHRIGGQTNPPGESTAKEQKPATVHNADTTEEKSHAPISLAPKFEPEKILEPEYEAVNVGTIDEQDTVRPLLNMTPVLQEVSPKSEVTQVTSGPEIAMEHADVCLMSSSDDKKPCDLTVVEPQQPEPVQCLSPDSTPAFDDKEVKRGKSPDLTVIQNEKPEVTNEDQGEKVDDNNHNNDEKGKDKQEEEEEEDEKEGDVEQIEPKCAEEENVEDVGVTNEDKQEQEETDKESVQAKEDNREEDEELNREELEEDLEQCAEAHEERNVTQVETENLNTRLGSTITLETESAQTKSDTVAAKEPVPVSEISSPVIVASEAAVAAVSELNENLSHGIIPS